MSTLRSEDTTFPPGSPDGEERKPPAKVSRATLADLRPSPEGTNARRHSPRNIGMIVQSLQEVGAGRSIVMDENNDIIGGSGTYEAAAQAGMENVIVVDVEGDQLVAVRRSNLSEEQKVRMALWDNRTQETSSWDDSVLLSLSKTEALDGLFSTKELDALLARVKQEDDTDNEEGAGGDEYDTTPSDGPSRVLRGEIYKIGPHLLMCGDCRSTEDMAALFGVYGKKAEGFFTSPPYAEQRAGIYDSVHEDDYVDWWEAVQREVASYLNPNGSFFVNIKPHARNGERSLYVMDLVLAMKRKWGWSYVDELCWLRINAPGYWPDRLKNGFEPIHQFTYGNTPIRHRAIQYAGEIPDSSAPRHDNAGTGYYYNVRQHNTDGMAYPDNVVDIRTSDHGIKHPAIFPVALPTFFYKAFSDRGAIWCDPFSGSGTSLIAAHRAGFVSYNMEISPAYCDVILSRALAEGISPIERITVTRDERLSTE